MGIRQGQLKMELLLDSFPVAFAEHRILLALPIRQTLPRAWDKAFPPVMERIPSPCPSQPLALWNPECRIWLHDYKW